MANVTVSQYSINNNAGTITSRITASLLGTASRAVVAESLSSGFTGLGSGSTYPFTSSWAGSSSWSPNIPMNTGSTYPFTSSWASNATTAGTATTATTATNANNVGINTTSTNQNFSIVLITGSSGYGAIQIDGSPDFLYNPVTNLLTVNGGITENGAILFTTDNTYDIGSNGATRPRTVYAGTSVITNVITASKMTGSLAGSASYATNAATASLLLGSIQNAVYATSASFASSSITASVLGDAPGVYVVEGNKLTSDATLNAIQLGNANGGTNYVYVDGVSGVIANSLGVNLGDTIAAGSGTTLTIADTSQTITLNAAKTSLSQNVLVGGNLEVTGSATFGGGITGSILTASYSITSSAVADRRIWSYTTPVSRSSNGSTDTNEVSLKTLTIPGGTLGPYDWVRIVSTWTWTSGLPTQKRAIIEFSGSEFLNFSTTTNTALFQGLTMIANNNSTSSQVGASEFFSGIGTSGFGTVVTTIDTSIDQLLDFRCKWQANVTSSDYIQLERFLVEIIRASPTP